MSMAPSCTARLAESGSPNVAPTSASHRPRRSSFSMLARSSTPSAAARTFRTSSSSMSSQCSRHLVNATRAILSRALLINSTAAPFRSAFVSTYASIFAALSVRIALASRTQRSPAADAKSSSSSGSRVDALSIQPILLSSRTTHTSSPSASISFPSPSHVTTRSAACRSTSITAPPDRTFARFFDTITHPFNPVAIAAPPNIVDTVAGGASSSCVSNALVVDASSSSPASSACAAAIF